MSGVEPIRGQTESMTFSYEQLINLPNTEAEPENKPNEG